VSIAFVGALLVGAPAAALPTGDEPSGDGGADAVPELDLSSPSLSPGGRDLAGRAGLPEAPRYALAATVDPRRGALAGHLRANLPPPGAGELQFRVFAGIPELDTGIEVDDVTIDGNPVDSHLDASLLTVTVPEGARDRRVEVAMRFSYLLPKVESGGPPDLGLGESLDPAAVGLLGRHRGGATLGHWFPVWLAPGASSEPEPDGLGDLGNFPAAVFRARITVPEGFEVVTGGVRVDEQSHEGGATFVEAGVGLRDFAVYVGRRRATEEVDAGGATVRVTGPRSARAELPAVAEESGASLTTFAETFAPYPWTELDVVSVPLGSGVAGMEWPGMVWIEAGTFAGGIPGLGDLPDLDELFDDLQELLDDLGVEDLGLPDLSELLGGLGGGSTREFVIAHEVAHQWWHALVGNDSITAPVVDEPLAQFSACVHVERQDPEGGDEACAAQTDAQYETMRLLGEEDAPADRPTDAFTSSLQYGGVVYGKAPGFYRALGDLIGPDTVLAGLRAFVTAHPFGVAAPDDLRVALAAAAPGREAEVDALWQRWIEGAHGDEDLGATPLPDADADADADAPSLDRLMELLERLTEVTTGR